MVKKPQLEDDTFEADLQLLRKELEVLEDNKPLKQWLKDREQSQFIPGDTQARFILDDFYLLQRLRKRALDQERALGKEDESAYVVDWLGSSCKQMETWLKASLVSYVAKHPLGEWLGNVYGIGPLLAAALIAYIDIEKAPTAGHIWQFFGIAGDNQRPWLPKTKRPWSAAAKTLGYKIGESFIKFSNHPKCYYGHLYKERKEYEVRRNDSGGHAAQAMREAPNKGKETEAWPWNNACFPAGTTAKALEFRPSKADPDNEARVEFLEKVRGESGSGVPMLHLGHIDDRARRYAVKIFLSHLHMIWFKVHYKKPAPKPFAIAILGHAHELYPPVADAAD